jgi:hypothetical protein
MKSATELHLSIERNVPGASLFKIRKQTSRDFAVGTRGDELYFL